MMNSEIFNNKKQTSRDSMNHLFENSGIFFLGKKSTRNNKSSELIYEKRCDICLEYEKYSESKLIECQSCEGTCHKKCLEKIIPGIIFFLKENNGSVEYFECMRCLESKKLN